MATSQDQFSQFESLSDDYIALTNFKTTTENEELVKDESEVSKPSTSHEMSFHRYFKNGILKRENSPSIDNEESIQSFWEKNKFFVKDPRKKMKKEENMILTNSVPPEEEILLRKDVNAVIKASSSEINMMEIDCKSDNENINEELNRKPKENQNSEVINKLVEEDLRKKIEKNKSKSTVKKVKENSEMNKNTKGPIIRNPVETKLSKKIKKNPWIIGIVAFSYNANPFEGVKNFTLATFQDYVIKERCSEDWIKKLSYLVKKMQITHLYVQGYRQTLYLRSKLNILVFPLPKRDLIMHCPVCLKRSCSIFKVQTYFQSFHSYKAPFVCYGFK